MNEASTLAIRERRCRAAIADLIGKPEAKRLVLRAIEADGDTLFLVESPIAAHLVDAFAAIERLALPVAGPRQEEKPRRQRRRAGGAETLINWIAAVS